MPDSTGTVRAVTGAGVEELRRLVMADPELQSRLLAIPERATFVAAVVALAREHGLALTASDVEDALTDARQRLRGQWV